MSRILVADDERGICEAFGAFLTGEGHEPLLVSNGKQAVQMVRDETPAVAFIDIQMPGGDGLTALEEIKGIAPDLPVIIMTAFGTLESARRAIDLGAFDYLGKPVELDQVRELLKRALHKPRKSSVAAIEAGGDGDASLLGQSAAMQTLFKKMALLGNNDLAILITGESGVGKELVAKAVHKFGPNSEQPFIAVNCAAIPDTLIEAELFGSEAGAFTDAKNKRVGRFEAAGTGTLFLDEVAEIPLHLQSKLLRVLQEHSFERLGSVTSIAFTARIVAASNRSLEDEVEAGNFREDLYHRLNLASLRVPALRDREHDLELLMGHFLHQANREIGKQIHGIEADVVSRLKTYSWPGNVRELEHCVKRAVLAARGTTITLHDLDLAEERPAHSSVHAGLRQSLRVQAREIVADPDRYGGSGFVYQHLMDAAGLEIIHAALALTKGNQVAAAKLLGINRSTLRKKLSEAD
ncbi:MAG: sigma-54-dependent Fis family transcriptional regulator [Gammaproteobacteria bacterium]|nr:sigma-54-dependent Fis family transcriptional regulator [Gammaproteobacteria bacterium]